MTMRLADLLDGFADASGAGELDVSGLAIDSREIEPGNAFVALRGTKDHGIAFAAKAGYPSTTSDHTDIGQASATLSRTAVAVPG